MKIYTLVIAYDGTEYAGWQVQPHNKAVANVIQNTFYKIFQRNCILLGASRTDAGVHALGQVARLSTDLTIPASQLIYALNNALPDDIVIRSLTRAPDDFHPIAHVTQKTYWYHFFLTRPLPSVARYGYYFYHKIDHEKLKAGLQVFVGTHDFRAFTTGDEKENTVRTIDRIELVYVRAMNGYRIVVEGRGFLKYMIRRIVGACLEVASRDTLEVSYLMTVLAAKNPGHHLPKAPAHGLVLRKIRFD